MTRRWRLAAAVVVILAALDVLIGALAYGSPTWNFSHTEVLRGWANVRQACLVMFPLSVVITVLLGALVWVLVGWASRGDR